MFVEDTQLQDLHDTCICCFSKLEPTGKRDYQLTAFETMCYRCACQRGGVYDDCEKRWTTLPNTSDLAWLDQRFEM